jgi:hypothetical protein
MIPWFKALTSAHVIIDLDIIGRMCLSALGYTVTLTSPNWNSIHKSTFNSCTWAGFLRFTGNLKTEID